jgi:hypothetical protein
MAAAAPLTDEDIPFFERASQDHFDTRLDQVRSKAGRNAFLSLLLFGIIVILLFSDDAAIVKTALTQLAIGSPLLIIGQVFGGFEITVALLLTHFSVQSFIRAATCEGFLGFHYHQASLFALVLIPFSTRRRVVLGFSILWLVLYFAFYFFEEAGILVPVSALDIEGNRRASLARLLTSVVVAGVVYVHPSCPDVKLFSIGSHQGDVRVPLLQRTLNEPLAELRAAADRLRASSEELERARHQARDAVAAFSHGTRRPGA